MGCPSGIGGRYVPIGAFEGLWEWPGQLACGDWLSWDPHGIIILEPFVTSTSIEMAVTESLESEILPGEKLNIGKVLKMKF